MYLSLITSHICPILSNPPSGEDTQARIIAEYRISIIANILHQQDPSQLAGRGWLVDDQITPTELRDISGDLSGLSLVAAPASQLNTGGGNNLNDKTGLLGWPDLPLTRLDY